MTVFRITLAAYASQLAASGRPARWNGKGTPVIYTAGSAALACLENLAHRAGVDITMVDFSVAEIDIPETLGVGDISRDALERLHPGWYDVHQYPLTQKLGDQWVSDAREPVLRVPSAIIPTEYNYLLNPGHADFSRISVRNVRPFAVGHRILNG